MKWKACLSESKNPRKGRVPNVWLESSTTERKVEGSSSRFPRQSCQGQLPVHEDEGEGISYLMHINVTVGFLKEQYFKSKWNMTT